MPDSAVASRVPPREWPALLLIPLAVVLLLCAPALVGKVPFPTELILHTAPWDAQHTGDGPLDFTRIDSVVQYVAWALPDVERLHAGEWPLWNPYLFAGFPGYIGPGPYYPPFFPPSYLLARLLPPRMALAWQPIVLLWVSGVAMAAFLRTAGLRRPAALFGAMVWMCGTTLHAWFATPIFLLGLWGMPALCCCASCLVADPGPKAAGWTAVCTGLLLLAASPNPVVFAATLAVVWFAVNVIAMRPDRRTLGRVLGWGVVGAVCGLLLGAPGWLPFLEGLRSIDRSIVQSWEMFHGGRAPLLTLVTPILPEYFGGVWSQRSFLRMGLPEVVFGSGVIACVAAAAAYGSRHRRLLRFAVGAGVLFALVAVGAGIDRIFSRIPGYGTSILPRMFQIVEWALAVVAAVGMDRLLALAPPQAAKRVLIAGLVAGLATVCLVWMGPTVLAYVPHQFLRSEAVPPDAARHFAMGAPWWRPVWLALGLLILGALVGVATGKRWVVVGGLALAFLVERQPHVAHLTPWRDRDGLYPPIAALAPLAAQPEPVRVLNVAGLVNTLAPLHIASPEGYHPFVAATYKRLVETQVPRAGRQDPFAPHAGHYVRIPQDAAALLDMLNVQYVIGPGGRTADGAAPVPLASRIRARPSAWPRAVLIPDAMSVPDDASAMEAMRRAPASWRKRAVVTGAVPTGARGGDGTARILSYQPERVVVQVDASAPCFLLLADQYHPDWSATVDGAPVEILRAFLALRLVPVEAGRHIVEFRFAPPVLQQAAALCVLGLIGAVVLLRPRFGPRHAMAADA